MISIRIDGINNAIDRLERMRDDLRKKADLIARRLAEEGMDVASVIFQSAQYAGDNDVVVTVEDDGKHARVIASGKSVLFIEFGTGISFPEHESGLFAHGEYGKKRGANPKGWLYKGSQGTSGVPSYVAPGLYHTYGNPPAEAMWTAKEHIASIVEKVAREVLW